MASEHSFDIVSKVSIPEVVNAIDQSLREIKNRYDFKGSISNIELKEKDNKIVLTSDDHMRMKSVVDILQGKLVKRNVPLKNLIYGKVESAAGGTARQEITLQQGLTPEKAKEIVKMIKDTKMKVQAQIREGEIRVTGKAIDDLQTAIQALKQKDFNVDLQYLNYR